MSSPAVKFTCPTEHDTEFVYTWLCELFQKLRLGKNKISTELIRPDDGQDPYIKIERRG